MNADELINSEGKHWFTEISLHYEVKNSWRFSDTVSEFDFRIGFCGL